MALGEAVMNLYRILVATDFSSAGRAAVARGGQLAAQYRCQLMVCHATPDWTLFSQRAAAHQKHYADITRSAEEMIRAEVSWVSQEFGLTSVRGEVHRDRATLAITRAIESYQPNLLIIGAGGDRLLAGGATVLGGTALKLIARVGVPLLVVRNALPVPYSSTLVAIGGELSTGRRLTQWASALAGSGSCHVVRVYDAPYADRLRLCHYEDTEIAHSAEEQRLLALQDCAALEPTLPPGSHLSIHIVRGATVPVVLEQVQQYSPQLVVVGQHAHHSGEHPGAWAAGLGTRIAYHCPVDVLMVPDTP
jgi:nucleotide-binding universal stress UspA family protein